MFKITLSLFLGFMPALAFAEELVHTTATLSEARGYLAATSVGNLALFAGGRSESGYSDVVDIYDADTETWSTATLSRPRSNLAATSVGNLAIFAGGQQGTSNYSNVVDIYDADTGTWSTTTLSQPRAHLAATHVGNLAMFAGGYNESGLSNVVDIYDAQTGLWSVATLSQAQTSFAATTVGDKALFAGTVIDRSEIIVEIYNYQTGIWSTDVIPDGWGDICVATATGDKALFVNDASSSPAKSVYVHDDIAGQWSTTTLSKSRGMLAATSLGNKALFAGGYSSCSIGGCTGPGDLSGDGLVYGSDLDIIRTYWGQHVSPGFLWEGDPSGDGFVGGDDLDIVRSYWGIDYYHEAYSDTVDVYDAQTGRWSLETLSKRRHSLAGTTVEDFAIFGGGSIPTHGMPSGASPYTNVVDMFQYLPAVPQEIPEPFTLTLLCMGVVTLSLMHFMAAKISGIRGF